MNSDTVLPMSLVLEVTEVEVIKPVVVATRLAVVVTKLAVVVTKLEEAVTRTVAVVTKLEEVVTRPVVEAINLAVEVTNLVALDTHILHRQEATHHTALTPAVVTAQVIVAKTPGDEDKMRLIPN